MKNAYFTLATDDYALGAYCLAKSINKVSEYRLSVMDAGISEEKRSLLKTIGCNLIPVECLSSKTSRPQPYRENPNFANNCYNKIYLWKQEFEKIIYLDADTILLKNIDHLFELKEDFSACVTFQTKHCLKSGKILGAGWSNDYFNGGVLVLKPNKKTFNELYLMKDTVETPKDPSDQGLLNYYFSNKWGKLSPLYNFPKRAFEVDAKCWERYRNEIFVLHYTVDNPWSSVNQMWWSIFNS